MTKILIQQASLKAQECALLKMSQVIRRNLGCIKGLSRGLGGPDAKGVWPRGLLPSEGCQGLFPNFKEALGFESLNKSGQSRVCGCTTFPTASGPSARTRTPRFQA